MEVVRRAMETPYKLDDVMFRSGDDDDDVVYSNLGLHDEAYLPRDDVTAPGLDELELSSPSDNDSDNDQCQEYVSNRPLLERSVRVRRAHKHHRRHPQREGRCRRCLWRAVYLLLFVLVLSSVSLFTVYWVSRVAGQFAPDDVIGCFNIQVSDVWTATLPKLMTESAFRLLDVNNDSTLDVILGFATGVDEDVVPEVMCDLSFNGSVPCGGGLLALDGHTGRELWRRYTEHEIFGLNCGLDIDRDGTADCIAGGRSATFLAVSGRTGHVLWTFSDGSALQRESNFYTPQIVEDLNGDGIADVINCHGGDPTAEPGRAVVLFGTGGETQSGGLYRILLSDLYQGHMERAGLIHYSKVKGVMTPPVLVDITKDGVEDIVFVNFNSSLLVYDGATYQQLWNHTYRNAETYSTPAVGYYDDDDVPDFMVHWQVGPGYPVYYYSMTTVISGRTGRPLLQPFIKDTVGAQTSPLTVSMQGHGNDLFLYWISDCSGHSGEGGKFDFVKGTNVHEKSRADTCKGRFKTTGFSRMYATSQLIKPGAALVYDSGHDLYGWRRRQREVWQRVLQQWREQTEGEEAEGDEGEEVEAMGTAALNLTFYAAHWKNPPETSELMRYLLFKSVVPLERATAKFIQSERQKKSEQTSGRVTSGDSPGHELHAHDVRGGSATSHAADTPPGGQDWHHRADGSRPRDHLSAADWTKYLSDISHKALPNTEPDDRRRTWSRDRTLTHGYNGNQPTDDRRRTWSRDRPHGRHGNKHGSPVGGRRQQPIYDYYGSDQYPDYDEYGDPIDRRHRRSSGRRVVRHVGTHDDGGMQRLLSTGTLAPPLLPSSHPDYARSVDVVFATYWFYPKKPQILLPEDQKCIDNALKNEHQRFIPNSRYYGMDEDGYRHTVTRECLTKSGHLPKTHLFHVDVNFDPYDRPMGQLTIYRLHLRCDCDVTNSTSSCARVLPYRQQGWAGYMGTMATSRVNRP